MFWQRPKKERKTGANSKKNARKRNNDEIVALWEATENHATT
jgi:hypothetical protein